jgi:hypothetical protein
MSVYGSRRSRARFAVLALVIAAAACRQREHSWPIDAVPADATPADARPIDAPVVEENTATESPPIVTRIVAAGDSTCTVMSDLTLRCWGANAHGQLGDGTTSDHAAPVIPAIRAVKDLQLAEGTACALLDDGSVACWGRIGWHGHAEDVLRPTGVGGVIGVTQIFVLADRACARVTSGALVCWGNVDARGHFAAGSAHRAPTSVVGLDHIAVLRADAALSDDGRMWTWSRSGAPRRLEVVDAQEIASREGAVCGRQQDGRVMCAVSDRCGPRAPAKPAPPAKKPARKPGKPVAVKPAKPAVPARDPAVDPAEALGFPPARQLAFEIGFCVVTTTNKLQCGDGCARVEPVKLDRIDTVVGRCVLLRSGTVTCFDSGVSTAAPGVTRASLLAAGRAHACAMVEGRLVCWGSDNHHQLGDFALAR